MRETDVDLHDGHVEGGDLPEPGAVHLSPAQLLQDDPGLVHVPGEGRQVERSQLVPVIIIISSSSSSSSSYHLHHHHHHHIIFIIAIIITIIIIIIFILLIIIMRGHFNLTR